jgi:hypothetical protein
LSGPAWAGLGRASRAIVGPVQEFPKKRSWAAMVSWAENQKAAGKILSNFSNKDLILKANDSNTFKPNLNWNQTGIN